MPTQKDWEKLERRVRMAKRTPTIERATVEFDRAFNMGGAIAVYDDGEMYPEELAEYAIENIKTWRADPI